MGLNKSVTCPQCGASFDIEQSLRDEYNQKYKVLESDLRKQLEKKSKEEQEKNIALALQLERLQNEQANRDKQIELEKEQYAQKKLKESEEIIKQTVLLQAQRQYKIEQDKLATEYDTKYKEQNIQLEQLKKAVEEANRKAKQQSMQTQGEAQELLLEEWLANRFPFDEIKEVEKGARGADCIQVVRNEFGKECGHIVYESKNTQHFNKEWIDKLKSDMQRTNASLGILVTKVLPSELKEGGYMKGIWICRMHELYLLIPPIRQMIIKLNFAIDAQQNRDDKMKVLYQYITSDHFKNTLLSISDAFSRLKTQINDERRLMERLWKSRETELDKAFLSADTIMGSLNGIAASESTNELIDDVTKKLLPE